MEETLTIVSEHKIFLKLHFLKPIKLVKANKTNNKNVKKPNTLYLNNGKKMLFSYFFCCQYQVR